MWVKEICQQVELGLEGWIGLKTEATEKNTHTPNPCRASSSAKA